MSSVTPNAANLHTLVNDPGQWDFSGAKELRCGVDVGTATVVAVVVDQDGKPRAARLEPAQVVKSGLVVDFAGASRIVRRLLDDLRQAAPLPLEKGATSYPPNTESGNINTTRYILEGAGLTVEAVLDEPTAAKLALDIEQGAVVDVGGGTTGVSVVQQGRVVYSGDEATGGTHLSLVLAGGYGIDFEEAEKLKTDPSKSRDILPVVRPVLDKISTIIARQLHDYPVRDIWMVGGTCELEGMCEVVADNLGLRTRRPDHPQMVTPYGIALSSLNGHGGFE